MEKTERQKANFGLVGKDISYSFSRGYFKKKFEDMGLNNHSYQNFDLQSKEKILATFIRAQLHDWAKPRPSNITDSNV